MRVIFTLLVIALLICVIGWIFVTDFLIFDILLSIVLIIFYALSWLIIPILVILAIVWLIKLIF